MSMSGMTAGTLDSPSRFSLQARQQQAQQQQGVVHTQIKGGMTVDI
jgi:hypothetical protein